MNGNRTGDLREKVARIHAYRVPKTLSERGSQVIESDDSNASEQARIQQFVKPKGRTCEMGLPADNALSSWKNWSDSTTKTPPSLRDIP
jgi:hypothetical protein